MWSLLLSLSGPAHALGALTGCRADASWAEPIAAWLGGHTERCVLSFLVNDAESWWMQGSEVALVDQIQWLRARTVASDGRLGLWIVLHRGTPRVSALGQDHPALEADWRLTLVGGRRRARRRGPLDSIAWARLDVWLGGSLDADLLQIPDAVWTTLAPGDALQLMR